MQILFEHQSAIVRRACAILKSTGVVLLSAALLAGCSGMRIVDSDVVAF